MTHTFSSSIPEVEGRRSLWVRCQYDLQSECQNSQSCYTELLSQNTCAHTRTLTHTNTQTHNMLGILECWKGFWGKPWICLWLCLWQLLFCFLLLLLKQQLFLEREEMHRALGDYTGTAGDYSVGVISRQTITFDNFCQKSSWWNQEVMFSYTIHPVNLYVS